MPKTGQVRRIREAVLIRPSMLEPATPGFKVVGCFNPAAVKLGRETWLILRVAEAPEATRKDRFPSPRVEIRRGKSRVTVDQIPHKPRRGEDGRVLVQADGTVRLRFLSHLRLARVSADGLRLQVLDQRPWLFPEKSYEEFGVEDARATLVNGKLYVTYVAPSRELGIATALLEARSIEARPKRLGVILPAQNKDVLIFPRRFGKKFLALHRPVSRDAFTAPNIQFARSPDMVHWGGHGPMMSPAPGRWDSDRIGGGPPPVRIKEGWLFIYHGVERRPGQAVGSYSVGAALLDARDPTRVLARAPRPILRPARAWEKRGFTPNVIFPSGATLRGDELTLFCGAADTCVSSVTVSLKEVLSRLRKPPAGR